jgi:hypothetical protein
MTKGKLPRIVEPLGWEPTPGWRLGERWELCKGRVALGRVVILDDRLAHASVYLPKHQNLGRSYASLREAAAALLDHCKREKLA